ncbi:hypothetical protein F5884DRAFT_227642 [Xylogone sp. PMI_703]|nr:hypothetical protein F5884DRAFT_227642 [Xylogone sp. PMI_703]
MASGQIVPNPVGQKPFHIYEAFSEMGDKRMKKQARAKYPDIEAFGPIIFRQATHPVPTAQDIITNLQRYNFKDQRFEVLQSLAESMVLYSKHGQKILPLGQIGARQYQLQLLALSQTSLNDNDEFSRIRAGIPASCFLSNLEITIRQDNSKSHRDILPLGVLLVDGSQVPWIVFIDQTHQL